MNRKLRVLEKWDEYLRMVQVIEEKPENRDGSDKSHVERSDRVDREHYRNAVRVR